MVGGKDTRLMQFACQQYGSSTQEKDQSFAQEDQRICLPFARHPNHQYVHIGSASLAARLDPLNI
jgi:hypothetical protein